MMISPAVYAQGDAKALRIVVPFAPGGAGDVVARVLAPPLSEKLQRLVIVENKPGASTILGVRQPAECESIPTSKS